MPHLSMWENSEVIAGGQNIKSSSPYVLLMDLKQGTELWLRFAAQIWSDTVTEKFGTAAEGRERRRRHKWKVGRQDKG